MWLSFLKKKKALAFGLVKRIPSDVALKIPPSGSCDARKGPLCHLAVPLTKCVWSTLSELDCVCSCGSDCLNKCKKNILTCVKPETAHRLSENVALPYRRTVPVSNVNTLSKPAMENISEFLLFLDVRNRCWHLTTSSSSWLRSQAWQNEPKHYSLDWCSFSAKFSCVFSEYEHLLTEK